MNEIFSILNVIPFANKDMFHENMEKASWSSVEEAQKSSQQIAEKEIEAYV